MQYRKFVSIARIAMAAMVLSSCTTMAPVAPVTSVTPSAQSQASMAATYANLALSGGKLFPLDPVTSQVRIYAFRAGAAAKLGHNHVLSAPRFTGFFYLPTSGSTDARFDLEFRLDELEIDKPEYRASLGTAFATTISPGMIASTREHMLGEGNFQAEQYPLVRIHAVQIIGESPKFAAKVRIEMHGQAHEMWVPLTVEGLPDHLAASGSLVLRQSDFGVKPYSALGGILAIQDEVVIDFKLLGQ